MAVCTNWHCYDDFDMAWIGELEIYVPVKGSVRQRTQLADSPSHHVDVPNVLTCAVSGIIIIIIFGILGMEMFVGRGHSFY